MEGHSSISGDVLASYAADAAAEVPGVTGLVETPLHRHRGVRVSEADGGTRVEVHVAVAWGTTMSDVGAEVQARVTEYLERMAGVVPAAVDVVVDEVTPPVAER